MAGQARSPATEFLPKSRFKFFADEAGIAPPCFMKNASDNRPDARQEAEAKSKRIGFAEDKVRELYSMANSKKAKPSRRTHGSSQRSKKKFSEVFLKKTSLFSSSSQ